MDIPNNDQEPTPPKPIWDLPPVMMLLFLLICIFLFGLLGSGLVYLLGLARGVDLLEVLSALGEQSPLEDRNFVRSANFISHFMTFTAPALIVVLFFYRGRWLRFLKLSRSPGLANFALGVLFIIGAFPLAQLFYWLNQQFPLPEWAGQLENSAEGMISGLLVMESPVELMFNLLVVAVLPAVGEELVFRGIIQQKIEEISKRPLLAIWLTAIFFSAFHLQFQGFLPRLLLGAILGYLFYWTGNLWVPMAGHFATNAMQVIGQYLMSGKLTQLEMDQPDSLSWPGVFLSIAIILAVGYVLQKRNAKFDFL